MELVHGYRLQIFDMLPISLQSRLPDLPARLKSFRSMHYAVTSGASNSNQETQQRRRSRLASIFTIASSDSSHVNEYADSTDFSSSELQLSTSSRHSASTSVSSIVTSEDDHPFSDDLIEDRQALSAAQYEQLARQFLQYVKDVDARRHLNNQTLLEASSQMPSKDRDFPRLEPRLPRNFNGSSHNPDHQRWSPSGIKWRYARQGAQLATDASNERHDPEFERSAYIDAVAYYLRGCPDQLDHDEALKLRCAAPWLAEQPHPAPQIAIAHPTDRGMTFLSYSVKYAVVAILIYAHVLWTFLVSAFRVGAYLDREYNMVQRLMTNGYGMINTAARHGLTLTAWISATNDGRFGQVVSWTVDSVLSGLQEGYGQAMDHIRQQDAVKE